MALDPDLHLKQWLIEDIRLTLVMDEELREAGEPLLEDANRANLEQLRATLTKSGARKETDTTSYRLPPCSTRIGSARTRADVTAPTNAAATVRPAIEIAGRDLDRTAPRLSLAVAAVDKPLDQLLVGRLLEIDGLAGRAAGDGKASCVVIDRRARREELLERLWQYLRTAPGA